MSFSKIYALTIHVNVLIFGLSVTIADKIYNPLVKIFQNILLQNQE